MTARSLTLFSGGVDGAGQLGVRLGGLGGHDDLCAVPGRLEGDRLADAAGGARDVQDLARQFAKGKTKEAKG